MAYYIYENWQAGPHKAVLHHGSCGHCKDGAGRAGYHDPSHGKWHGPFNALEAARAHQQGMNVMVRKDCHWCMGAG